MKENTFMGGGHSVTIRLKDEYLNEFLLIMRELTRHEGVAIYEDIEKDFWSEKGWADIEDDGKHVEENKFYYIVKVTDNEIFSLKRPRREWTVGGFKLMRNISIETDVFTTQSVIDAVKSVGGLIFDGIEIVEMGDLVDSDK